MDTLFYQIPPTLSPLGSFPFGNATTLKVAQEITMQSNAILNSVGAWIYKSGAGTPTGNLVLNIYQGGTNPENGTLIAGPLTFPMTSLDTGQTFTIANNGGAVDCNVIFTLTSPLSLISGTTYYFTITRSDAPISSPAPTIYYYLGDYFSYSNRWSGNWTEYTDRENMFLLYTTSGLLPPYNPSIITAVVRAEQNIQTPQYVIAGQGTGGVYSIFKKSSLYNFTNWRSPLYQIGRNFNILTIRFSIVGGIQGNMSIIPVLYFDNESSSSIGASINATNYPNSEKLIKLSSKNFNNNVHGRNNFFLELQITGSDLAVVRLPIEIELDEE